MTHPGTEYSGPRHAHRHTAEANADAEPARPKRRRWRWLWVVLALVAAGGAWAAVQFTVGKDRRESLPPESTPAPRDPAAVTVTTDRVAYRPLQRVVEGVGTLHAYESVTIAPKVEGRVSRIHRDVADRVRPGELLLEIDPTEYEQAVEQEQQSLRVELSRLGLEEPPTPAFDPRSVPTVVQARVRMDSAKARHDRIVKLATSGGSSGDERDTVTADYLAAQAETANQVLLARAGLATIRMKQAALAIARRKLAETRVLAPVPSRPVPGAEGGTTYAVTMRGVSEGTMVRPGTDAYRLVIDQALKLRLPVPERYAAEVKVGQAVDVTTAVSPRPVAGTVAVIGPAVDPATRTFEVEVRVPNPAGEQKPGGFAKAAIRTRVDAEAVGVPLTAPYSFAGTTRVFLVGNGAAKEVPVTLGMQSGNWVEVTSPVLPRGAEVVTSGQAVLADGTPVAVRGAP